MHQLGNYEVYIFDCDGVILDSNQLKIEAMRNTLKTYFSTPEIIESCVDYFRKNFGKSRFHHVAHFLNVIIDIPLEQRSELECLILKDFSKQCRVLYLLADLTPGFIQFVKQCKGKKYVASGSEQNELREVFCQRGLDKYFDNVFGSPTPKAELIKHILDNEQTINAVMFGDALSDLQASQKNKIDFVFYAPYSNVQDSLFKLSLSENFPILRNW